MAVMSYRKKKKIDVLIDRLSNIVKIATSLVTMVATIKGWW